MGFKEFIQGLGKATSQRKERFSELQDEFEMQRKLQNMQKSSNERELERFMKEEREAQIKEQLEDYRKKKQEDVNFNHNALNVANITNHTDWEVMKERNMFKGNGNMFSNAENVIRDNPNLLRNNRSLF